MISIWMALMACNGGDDGNGPTAEAETITFVTYNAGLARGFVPGADSRQDAISTALSAIDVDIVCLQEVWAPDQVASIAGATLAAFPNQYFPDPQQSTDAICLDGQLDSLLSCYNDKCPDVCTDQVDDCLLDNCSLQFGLLAKDCMRCAMANVGSDADQLVQACEVEPVEYAYGGSFGTGILSKFPIKSVEETVFTSTSNRRSVLHAVVEAPAGDLDLYCTHLTAAFDSIPYPRASGNWIEEQAVQIQQMNDLIVANGGDHIALLGDMNTGPSIAGMDGETVENWAIFEDYDWAIPYIEQDSPSCTYCGENPLIGIDDSADRVIDHIMLRGFAGDNAASRVLDSFDTTAESCGDVIDPSALSDHYGVQVEAAW